MKAFDMFHPLVRILLIGTLFSALFHSLSYPFLTIFLSEHTELSLSTIGFILGLGAFSSTIGGFIGGIFSDRIGRTRLMLLSLMFSGIQYVGLAMIPNVIAITLLFTVGGFLGSFFDPVSRALAVDLTKPQFRIKVHSWRYLAVNIGYGIGPLLGLLLGFVGGWFSFCLLGILYFFYACVLFFFFRRYRTSIPIVEEKSMEGEGFSFRKAFSILWIDRSLFMLIIAGILTTSVEGLWTVPMAAYLPKQFSEGEQLLASLLTINSVTVVLSHFILTRHIEKYKPFTLVAVGSTLFILAEIGFAVSTAASQVSIFMVVFTVGEVLIVPAMYGLLDRIAPTTMSGTYFGAFALSGFGNFIGPWLSTFILTHWGGMSMFLALAFISALSIIFYKLGSTPHSVNEKSLSQQIYSPQKEG